MCKRLPQRPVGAPSVGTDNSLKKVTQEQLGQGEALPGLPGSLSGVWDSPGQI